MTTTEIGPQLLGGINDLGETNRTPTLEPSFEARLKEIDYKLGRLGVAIPQELTFNELQEKYGNPKTSPEATVSFSDKLHTLKRRIGNFAMDSFAKFLGNTTPYREPEQQASVYVNQERRRRTESQVRTPKRWIAAVAAISAVAGIGVVKSGSSSSEQSSARIPELQAATTTVDITLAPITPQTTIETTVTTTIPALSVDTATPVTRPIDITTEQSIVLPLTEPEVASASAHAPVDVVDLDVRQHSYDTPPTSEEVSTFTEAVSHLDLRTTMPYAVLNALGVHPSDFDYALTESIQRYNLEADNIAQGVSLSWREGRIWMSNGSMIDPDTLAELNEIIISNRT
jgi:hypothetical protein